MAKGKATTAVANVTASGLPATWEDELASAANEAAEAEKSTGNSSAISIKGGHFTYRGDALESPIQTVVLDFSAVNALYEGRFDPDNPTSPVCFAMGKDPESLRPHADSPKPQHADCATCPKNAFGSGEGRGKACKNTRRIALVAYDAETGVTPQAEPAMLSIPPTSLKFWAGFVKKLKGALKRPPWSVITDWRIEPAGGAYVVVPSLNDVINDPQQLTVIKGLVSGVQDELLRPFAPREATAAPAQKGGQRRAPVASVPAKGRAKF